MDVFDTIAPDKKDIFDQISSIDFSKLKSTTQGLPSQAPVNLTVDPALARAGDANTFNVQDPYQQTRDIAKQRAVDIANKSPLEGIGISPQGIQTGANKVLNALPQGIQPAAKALAAPGVAVDKTLAGIVDFITSPKGAAQTGLAALPPARIPMAIKFFQDMAIGGSQSASDAIDAYKKGDLQGTADAVAATLANFGGAAMLGAHTALPEAKTAPEAPKPATEPPAPPQKPLGTIGDVFDKLSEAQKAKLPTAQGNREGAASQPLPTPEKVSPTAGASETVGTEAPTVTVKGAQNTPIVNENQPTSIKNSVVDEERAKRGLPAVEEPARRSFGTVWDSALEEARVNPSATDDLIKELTGKPRALNDVEDAMLLKRQIDLQNEHGKQIEALKAAQDSNDPAKTQEHKLKLDALNDKLLDLYNINKTAGTETGRGLNARRMMANEDYSLAAMQTKFRATKKGSEPLTPEETKAITDIHERMQGISQRLTALEQKPVAPKVKFATAEHVVKLLDNRANAARQRIRERSGRLNIGIDPTFLRDYAEIGASHIAHLGLDFAKWSDAMIGEFGEAIKPHLQQIFDASKKTHDEANSPALKSAKTRYANKTEELKAKTEAGDTSKPERKTTRLDPEAQKLKAAYENAKLQFDRMVEKERLKNRSILEKTQDTFVKWRRAFLLSSPVTLAKLTSAALERGLITPTEEAVGSVLGSLPLISKVSERAPRESGMNIKAEARSIRLGFTKGMYDAYNVLTKGHSDIDSIFGKRDVMPREMIDFIGNIHGALKAPVKRAEFERSFEKRIEFAIRNGVDVTDPMVQTRISLDAYKDAQKAIFMQDNMVTAGWQAWLKILQSPDKSGKTPNGRKALASAANVILPIVKVPTNIIAETLQYATGSVTGSVRLGLALRRGVENLKPEEADLIMRELKKGSLGAAFLLLGFLNPHIFGGYYQQNDQKMAGHPKWGSMLIDGWNVPSFLVHNPLLETLQIGATVRHVADSKLRKKDGTPQGIPAGVLAGMLGLTEEVPFVEQPLQFARMFNPYERQKFMNQFAEDMIVPLGVKWVAEHFDRDAQGNYIARDPKTLWQAVETSLPKLRENVPVKKKTPHG